MAEPQLDLNKLIASGGLQITSEHDDERASRLAREEADARAERHKDLVRFYAVLLGACPSNEKSHNLHHHVVALEARTARHVDVDRPETDYSDRLLAGSIVFGLAVHVGLWDADASPDAKKWAMAVLAAFVTGPVGYVIGRKTK